MNCTAEDCDTPATLYLCEHHRLELKDLLEGIDFLIVNLDPLIQSGKVTKKLVGKKAATATKQDQNHQQPTPNKSATGYGNYPQTPTKKPATTHTPAKPSTWLGSG